MIALISLAQGQQQPDVAMLTDRQLHVVMCGSGSPLADPNRASACVAVVAGEEVILVDIGPGSWRQVAVNKLPTRNVSAILLTHYHSDHIGAARAVPPQQSGTSGPESSSIEMRQRLA